MSVEQAVHQHWALWKPLTDLVPESRVVTGLAQGEPALPYVTIQRQGDAATTRTSSGTLLDTLRLRFSIWDDRLDRALLVARELRQRFNRADFGWSQGRVLDCRQVQHAHLEEEDGIWRVMLDYELRSAQTDPAA